MENQNYNGWANRETWLVNLHFNPETKSDVDYIKDTLEEQEANLEPFFRDFIDLSKIDWEELENSLDDEGVWSSDNE